MKTRTIHMYIAALLVGSFSAAARDRAVILTTHVPVNDALTFKEEPARRLFITDDGNYADPRWHRVPGLEHTVMRTILVDRHSNPHFITQTRRVSSTARYPAERVPKVVWSRAFYAYVPYPVDYSSLNPQPEREHVGYTTIERIEPVQPETFTPIPPIAEGPRRDPVSSVVGTAAR